jgi:hypothetical protein
MRLHARSMVMAVFTVAVLALVAPAAQASEEDFGAETFEAGTCTAKPCTYQKIEEGSGEQFTQAAGHPTYGITSFVVNHEGSKPDGAVKRLRVDVPAGLAADPQALPFCTVKQFEENACPAETQAGTTELEAAATIPLLGTEVLTLEGTVYNLERKPGLPLEFGIKIAPAEPLVSAVHLYLEGHVSDTYEPSLAAHGEPSDDYHEYFEINGVPNETEIAGGIKIPLEVLKSKLLFEGTKGGNFLTLPSVCSSTTTSYLELESYGGKISHSVTHTPVGVEGCDKVPFKPTAEVKAETSTSDQPDGATTVVTVPQNAGSTEINTADINDAQVTLPEGLTLNPSAAHGLEACTKAQIAIGSTNAVTCPAASKIGTVTIETDLPPKALTGNVYLGSPNGGPITKPPFTIYLDAESSYGVSVRLEGTVTPNPSTGRLTVNFDKNPQLPFSELILKLNGGTNAPLANPLACSAGSTEYAFTPYTGTAAAVKSTPFAAPTGCPSPLPFSLSQSSQSSSSSAGAYTSYTLNFQRANGQQYLSQLSTILPPGLVGDIPSVPLCGEPQAANGECPATSNIGTATVTVGAGEPYTFTGPVSLTGPYNGAPYGLSIPIEAAAGPFDLGRVTTRAAINVEPYSGRVTATASIPTIVQGVPLRLKTLSVAINRNEFLFNPTSCNPLATNSQLTSTSGTGQSLSSPFQVSGCSALPFTPSFAASTSSHANKPEGASLQVTLKQPGAQANIRSVVAQLPLQLPSRLATLHEACPEATFAAGFAGCPPLSKVGTAEVKTPVLPLPLKGSAYVVSHGGAAFPDLDLVLEGNGVRVILVGNTNIKGGITTSTFASVPDVPVSSFSLTLPMQKNSLLSPYGNLCLKPLMMPTTITAQSGKVFKQETRIAVSGCGVRILSHHVAKKKLVIKVRTLGGGLITVTGKGLRKTTRRVKKSSTVTFRIPLTKSGKKALRKHPHRALSVSVRVGFKSSSKGVAASAALATAKFKH